MVREKGTIMADMLDIVKKQERDGKFRFYTELAKHRKLVDIKYDQTTSDPAWMEIEESFQELKDAFITWQAFKAALDIYRDEA